jgi:23S rRNA (cytidine1920-2'-O)/16S rRNA (cytidine1409-2'-O)-methyltransferase
MPNPAPGGPVRRRADAVLAERGLASSRARARAAIEAGGVTAGGRPVTRPSDLIDPEAEITFQPAFGEVSRAAGKLKGAPGFSDAPLDGAIVLDVGASTGGFTEVCLSRGAARVYAVDVGRGQLHPRLAADPRVVSLEGVDARRLDADLIPEAPGVVVCDASFIGTAPAMLSSQIELPDSKARSWSFKNEIPDKLSARKHDMGTSTLAILGAVRLAVFAMAAL